MAEVWQLEKPSWLRSVLEALNIHAGDWAELWGFKIPPFSFTPGEWIEFAIDWLLIPINMLLRMVNTLQGLVDQAWDAASRALSGLDDWLAGASSWFWSRLSGWWEAIWAYIRDWVLGLFNTLRTVIDPIVAWFASIDDWLKDKLLNVYGYISSVTSKLVSLDLFTAAWELVKPAIDAWSLFGGAFLDLIQYPVEWFSSAVLEPILGQFASGFEKDMEEANRGGSKT